MGMEMEIRKGGLTDEVRQGDSSLVCCSCLYPRVSGLGSGSGSGSRLDWTVLLAAKRSGCVFWWGLKGSGVLKGFEWV